MSSSESDDEPEDDAAKASGVKGEDDRKKRKKDKKSLPVTNEKEVKAGFGNLLAWKLPAKAMHNDYDKYTANIDDMPDATNTTTEIVDVGQSGQPYKPMTEDSESAPRDYNEMLTKETPSIVNGFEVVKGKQRARKKQADKLQTRIAFPKNVPQKRTHQQAFLK